MILASRCSSFNNMGGEGELLLCQYPFFPGECPIHEAMKYFASLTEAVSFSMSIFIRPGKKTAALAVLTFVERQELNPKLLSPRVKTIEMFVFERKICVCRETREL